MITIKDLAEKMKMQPSAIVKKLFMEALGVDFVALDEKKDAENCNCHAVSGSTDAFVLYRVFLQ